MKPRKSSVKLPANAPVFQSVNARMKRVGRAAALTILASTGLTAPTFVPPMKARLVVPATVVYVTGLGITLRRYRQLYREARKTESSVALIRFLKHASEANSQFQQLARNHPYIRINTEDGSVHGAKKATKGSDLTIRSTIILPAAKKK